jgi:hypothetical protein
MLCVYILAGMLNLEGYKVAILAIESLLAQVFPPTQFPMTGAGGLSKGTVFTLLVAPIEKRGWLWVGAYAVHCHESVSRLT